MNQWWQYWPGYFKSEECDKIIELAKTLPERDAKIGHASDTAELNANVRRSKIRWIPRYDTRFFQLFGSMELLLNEANRNAFGFDLTMFHEIQFTEYNAKDQGTYNWHHDTTWVSSKLVRRKLSLVIQLSDPKDYEGGRFEISKDDCDECPDPEKITGRGTVIIFPSFLRHRVTPVTTGIRYSLVSWMEGPYFR
jgi:PKHD-type hydroxylase